MRTRLLGLFLVVVVAAGLAASAQTPDVVKQKKRVIVDLVTSKGTITVELWPDKAPQTVQNFVSYVVDGFYEGTIFHRVIKGFMIQGGGFTADRKEKPTRPPIPLEAKEPNRKYTIAMARSSDPNSATSQFYINLVDNDGLNPETRPPGYTVFGKVIKGASVVEQIGSLPKANKEEDKKTPFVDITVPVVVIEKATLVK